MASYDVGFVPVYNTAGHLRCLQLIVFNTTSSTRRVSALGQPSCHWFRLSWVKNCARSYGAGPKLVHHLSLHHNVTKWGDQFGCLFWSWVLGGVWKRILNQATTVSTLPHVGHQELLMVFVDLQICNVVALQLIFTGPQEPVPLNSTSWAYSRLGPESLSDVLLIF